MQTLSLPILAFDQTIPHIKYLFSEICQPYPIAPNEINQNKIKHCDALIVRAYTPVNMDLLNNTSIKFIGTPTSGIDHLNIADITQLGLHWAYAPGGNSHSVVDYIFCCLAELLQFDLLKENNFTLGIVGIGHVGSQLAHRAHQLGIKTCLYDPPKALKNISFKTDSLNNLLKCHVICITASLTKKGKYPSFQMINKSFLTKLKPNVILINTSRGETINQQDLLHYGKHLKWIFDVWQNEPNINSDLIAQSLIATPHIAGRSVQSVLRSLDIIRNSFSRFFNIIKNSKLSIPVSKLSIEHCKNWREVLLLQYSPYKQTQEWKSLMKPFSPNVFHELRNYHHRHEFSSTTLVNDNLKQTEKNILSKLGFNY